MATVKKEINACRQNFSLFLHTLCFQTVFKVITYLVAFLVIQISNAILLVK